MRHIIVICLLCFSFLQAKAQIPNGSPAPDFTVVDVNGISWHLNDILAQNKSVVLDFSATWCSICWNYHNTHVLDNLYSSYGPSGTNEIQVLFLEADVNTNQNCLFGAAGCVGGTQGNWVSSSNYPVANLPNSFTQIAYNIPGYPTLFAISPDGKAYSVGTASKAVWETWLLQSFKMALTGVVTNGSCTSQGAIDLSVTAGFGTKTYLWSNGATTQDITGLAAGNYTVTVTDNHGYSKNQTFTVQSAQMPSSQSAANNNLDCSHSEVTVSGIGSSTGSNFTYLWTTTNGNIVSGANSINAIVNTAGTYSLKVTNTTTSCTATSNTTVMQVNNAPIANASSSTPLSCNASQVSLSGVGSSTGNNITYLWTTTNGNIVSGANTINPLVNAAGTYNLLVTNTTASCTANSNTTVTIINNGPIANAGNTATITCSSPQVTLNGSASSTGSTISYLWTTVNGNIVSGANSATPTVNKDGVYNLLVTNTANNCTANSNVNISKDVSPPTITVNNGSLTCSSNTTQICATISTPNTVSWNINGVTQNTNCVSVSSAGSYTATALAANGCTATATSIVTAAPNLPQIAFLPPPKITCTAPEIVITGQLTGNITEHSITWTTANGNIVSGGNTLTPLVNKTGIYKMTAINNSTNCQSTIDVMVDQFINTPVAAFTSSLGNGLLSLIGTNPNGTVTWTLGNGSTASGPVINITYTTSGNYEICMTVTNECGTHTSCSTIAYLTPLALTGTVTNPNCFGGKGSINTTISGVSATSSITYEWLGPNGFIAFTPNISDLNVGDYKCTVYSSTGVSASANFKVIAPPVMVATPLITNSTNNLPNGQINLLLTGGAGAYIIKWSNGGSGAEIKNLLPGVYSATVTDSNNCEKTFGPYEVQISSNTASDLEIDLSISVFPNPSSNFVNVYLENDNLFNQLYTIKNIVGGIIWSKKITSSHESIDVSFWPEGVYYLEVKGRKLFTKKFIVLK